MKRGPLTKFILEYCKWGIENEKVALGKYEKQLNVTISRCGFFLNPTCSKLEKHPPEVFSEKSYS